MNIPYEDDWYEYTEEYPYTDITDSDLLQSNREPQQWGFQLGYGIHATPLG